MAGKLPSFITGANAKIKVNDKTIAYAQDVSYNVTVSTIPIETMGRYEVVSNEPIAYFVDGTLSVIRYTKFAAAPAGDATKAMPGVAADGNSVGKWDGGKPGAGFNPGVLLDSETWDLDIFQKHASTEGNDSSNVIKLLDCRFTRKGSNITKRGILVEQYAFNAIYSDDDGLTTSGSGNQDLET